jgi:hypothetical protein
VETPVTTSAPPARDLFSAAVDSLLEAGLSVRFRAGGRSMTPTVLDGEYLIVSPVDPAQVGRGDIILCQTRRGPLAHRVCEIRTDVDNSKRYVLYGDASLDGDLPAAAHQLRGRVVGVERGGKQMSLRLVGGILGRTVFMLALELRRSALMARTRLGALLTPAGMPR